MIFKPNQTVKNVNLITYRQENLSSSSTELITKIYTNRQQTKYSIARVTAINPHSEVNAVPMTDSSRHSIFCRTFRNTPHRETDYFKAGANYSREPPNINEQFVVLHHNFYPETEGINVSFSRGNPQKYVVPSKGTVIFPTVLGSYRNLNGSEQPIKGRETWDKISHLKVAR
eukprot:scaffold24034_cov58-Attheya_sp.AAC.1